MPNYSEVILKSDGLIVARTVHESVLAINPVALQSLADTVKIKIRHIAELPDGTHLNLCTTILSRLWFWEARSLHLRCPYRIIKSGDKERLVPNFGHQKDPIIELVWHPPDGMRMLQCCQITGTGTNQVYVNKMWSVVVPTSTKAAYILPLPNLYDDGSVCLGEWEYWTDSDYKGILKLIDHFQRSKWNADLLTTKKIEQCDKLFSFEPTGKMECIEFTGDWTKLCYKVSTSITEDIL